MGCIECPAASAHQPAPAAALPARIAVACLPDVTCLTHVACLPDVTYLTASALISFELLPACPPCRRRQHRFLRCCVPGRLCLHLRQRRLQVAPQEAAALGVQEDAGQAQAGARTLTMGSEGSAAARASNAGRLGTPSVTALLPAHCKSGCHWRGPHHLHRHPHLCTAAAVPPPCCPAGAGEPAQPRLVLPRLLPNLPGGLLRAGGWAAPLCIEVQGGSWWV